MTPPAFVSLTPVTLVRPAHALSSTCRRAGQANFATWGRAVMPCMSTEAGIRRDDVKTEIAGKEGTMSYRVYYKSGKDRISPWHDIPLRPGLLPNVVNFVNEIPRGTQAKMEIATDEVDTPIKQDIKKGKLRYYGYGPSLVNYGAIPQTWEDPGTMNEELGVGGDGDPVDVTEIGEKVMGFGEVYAVKVLGCLGLVDEGEIDWKVIGINVEDEMAGKLEDVGDIERLMPGRIGEIREWFRLYKTAEGKGENEYAYGGEAKGAGFALGVVEEMHESWRKLREVGDGNGYWLG